MLLAASSLFGVKPTVSHCDVPRVAVVVEATRRVVVDGAAVDTDVVVGAGIAVVLVAGAASLSPLHDTGANPTTASTVIIHGLMLQMYS